MTKKTVIIVVCDADDADGLKMPESSWHVACSASPDSLASGEALSDLAGGFASAAERRRRDGKPL